MRGWHVQCHRPQAETEWCEWPRPRAWTSRVPSAAVRPACSRRIFLPARVTPCPHGQPGNRHRMQEFEGQPDQGCVAGQPLHAAERAGLLEARVLVSDRGSWSRG